MNLGDRNSLGKTKIYMNADVAITLNDVQRLVGELNENGCLAATPNIRMDFKDSSWMVRSYYDIWFQLP